MIRIVRLTGLLVIFLSLSAPAQAQRGSGEHEALRVYTEFADGKNRGMYDPVSSSRGYPDEDYDATTAMVINWHRMPEADSLRNATMRYRKVHPAASEWITASGESFPFWHREERINRVILTGLDPGSVYAFNVVEEGITFHFRTMPANLDERPLKIVMTADHQVPAWNDVAHANTKMAALQQPDLFVVAGDLVNDEGEPTAEKAERWARYLDNLYGVDSGYFIYDAEIDGQWFENLIIPHVSILGNHETGESNHIRWPACVNTGSSAPGYPRFVAANWMQLLFHWPYSSEGFYSEFHAGHPNLSPEGAIEGFGKGGFGKLSFGNYLLLIGLDNSQNFEGEPDKGLRDWEGRLITDRWPWFETNQAEVRQDVWLKNLLEPENGPTAGEVYRHILPVWHRGLFGTVRLNMSLKNRGILKYWLPVLYRNGVRLIKEGHDHNFTRTVPMRVTSEQPENTVLENVYYEPASWPLTDNLSQEYLDEFFAVSVLKDVDSGEIVGWEYEGNFITYDPKGFIAVGHGGWAAGRRDPGLRSGGNAGWWFVDNDRGGHTFGGPESFHMTTVHLTNDDIIIEAFHPDELPHFEQGSAPTPIHRFRWSLTDEKWYADASGRWVDY